MRRRWGCAPYGALSGGLKIGNVGELEIALFQNGLAPAAQGTVYLSGAVGKSNPRDALRVGAIAARNRRCPPGFSSAAPARPRSNLALPPARALAGAQQHPQAK